MFADFWTSSGKLGPSLENFQDFPAGACDQAVRTEASPVISFQLRIMALGVGLGYRAATKRPRFTALHPAAFTRHSPFSSINLESAPAP